MAELVLSAVLAIPPRTLLGRAALKAAIEMRRLLVDRGDPLVRHRVGAYELLLPLSHQLPIYRHDHPLYDTALGRVARVLAERHTPLTVVDVGANVGDSAAAVRTSVPDARLLCIEAHPRFCELLRLNARQFEPPLVLECTLLSSESGTTVGVLEEAPGTARLRLDGGGEVVTEKLSDVLARHPAYAEPALLKLDTDGLDCDILAAERELLATVRPVVFFEYDPDPHRGDREVFERFRELDYRGGIVWENTGEYARSLDLADDRAVAEVRADYAGHGGVRYADVCVFPAAAGNLFEQLLREERAAAS